MVTRISLLTLLLVLLAMPSLVYANSLGQGGVIFGRDFVVESSERVEGDVVIFGGDVEVQHGGMVEGDLAAIGGDVTIAGEVTGSLVVIGGDLHLAGSAEVGGDIIAPFSEIEQEPGAEVWGQVFSGRGPQFPGFRFRQILPWREIFFAGMFGDFLQSILTILGMVALGILAVALVPGPMLTVRKTLVSQLGPSLLVGFLAFVLLVPVSFVLLIICIGLFLLAGLVFAALFGWVTVGLLVGERILEAVQYKEKSPIIAAGLGTLLITLIAQIPCLGFLIGLGIGSWGLGAVLLTRFGTRPYP
ncbi:MAG: polymer-forming cytoskeletal protein [Chloroflexi bacterium]|nr:polymer-forming cytoskeletal protein [Chloroflexota bacterium]